MALRESLVSRLRLSLKVDEKTDGTPVLRNRTFNRMNHNLTDDDVLLVGSTMAALQQYPVMIIARIDENKVVAE